MVRTDGFVGKRKVKDRWEDGGFIVESQLEDWPVYKVRCPNSDAVDGTRHSATPERSYHLLVESARKVGVQMDLPSSTAASGVAFRTTGLTLACAD